MLKKKRKSPFPMQPTFIEATTLDDAWHQCLYEILRAEEKGTGRKYKIDHGSYQGQYRLEFDFVNVRIKFPETRPLAPIICQLGIPPPCTEEYIENDYLLYLLSGDKKPNEDYTYGERLVNPHFRIKRNVFEQILRKKGMDKESLEKVCQALSIDEFLEISTKINPVEEVIQMYKEKGYGTNQATLEIGMPPDITLGDPPCLRMIDTRIKKDQEGKWKLNFIVYFRSWDLWGGFPANLGGIQLLKEYMANSIGVAPGETIALSKGLHLYDHYWELAETLTYQYKKKIENEQR